MKKISEAIAAKFRRARLFNLEDIQAVREDGTELKHLVRKIYSSRDYNLDNKLYLIAQNMVSIFGDELSEFRIANPYFDVMDELEEEYMPDGPPFSPLTRSYFSYWQSFDYPFGKARETLGSIFYDLAKNSKLDKRVVDATAALNASRMGLYEVLETKGGVISLRELLTNAPFRSTCLAGYPGKPGDLVFARIAPGLSEPGGPSLIMTTPYIILNSKAEDWLAFFRRQGVDKAGLHGFFKYGPTEKYWHDYIMDGYVKFTSDRVYLTGIPDVPGSLPHAE
ncbi:MAG: hypothetical protein H6557_14150 [Lewinellaceae bacterium]|nr:hypothetical protein [Phaeodactylibacter sp.]MCB9037753.1 hypothetical protein [Lewinellaceae bacterium]